MLNSEQDQEQLIMRARLIASGVVHWSQYRDRRQVHLGLQILAKDLAKLEEPELDVEIRESLRMCGLELPIGFDTGQESDESG